MSRRSINRLGVLCLLSVTFATVSFAQVQTATLAGQVADNSGAGIPGASIHVVSNDTGITRDAQTDGTGRYVVPSLNSGAYSLTVEAQGFGRAVVSNLTLAVAQQANQDFTLQVGQVSQVVNVEATTPVVETDTSAVGTVVDNQQVVGLPLNNRTFYALALLSPATYQPAQNSNLSFRGGFSVAGSSEGSNTFILNGVDDNDDVVNVPDLRPSVEAIQEFKLVTGVAPAEYGRSSGGHVNTVTKSGGNKLSGDVFEFLRNDVMDARNYFNVDSGPKLGTRRNQYGGTLGGPVYIPKIYDGHNRTFFFVNYEGLDLAQGITTVTTVPTTAMLNGDFRSLLALAKPIHVVNPITGKDFTTPNVIDPQFISPIGKQLAALYPAPTNSGVSSVGPSSNYVLNEARLENLKLFGVKIDHRISEKDSIMGNYDFMGDPSFEPSNAKCGAATIPGFGCYQNDRANFAVVGETHIFTPNLLNDIRFGYARVYQQYFGQESFLYSNFTPLPNSYSGFPYARNAGPPCTTVSGMANLCSGSSNPQVHWGNKYDIVDTVSWTHGAHSLKVGADVQLFRSVELFIQNGRGSLTFNSSSAATSAFHTPTSGYSLADLLLGRPYQTIQTPQSPTYHPAMNAAAGFVEDDWKVTPYLTLNLGLRYEYFGPPYDPHNNMSLFNEATQTFNVSEQNGFSRGIWQRDRNNFAPRVGIAWQPFKNGNTVVRAAGGTFYNPPALGTGLTTPPMTQPPFRLTSTYTSSSTAPLTITSPFLAADAAQAIAPATIDRNYRTAYINEWSLGVEQKLTNALALTMDYVGSHGAKLGDEVNDNQATFTTVNGVTSCCTRPFGAFGNITHIMSEGSSSFNSLQTKLQQNYSKGLTLLLSYTYAKSTDSGSDPYVSSDSSVALPQNSFNVRAEHGPSDFDVRHRVVFSPVYELPFGRGKPYLTDGVASKILGGWQVSTITSVQTGRPFTVKNNSNNISGSLNNQDRPNISGDPNDGPKTVAEWFNVGVFSNAATHAFGNEQRNALWGPGLLEIDIAAQRTFTLNERWAMQFRAESFNVTNHPNFYNPSGTGAAFGSSQFGQITTAYDPRQMQIAAKILF